MIVAVSAVLVWEANKLIATILLLLLFLRHVGWVHFLFVQRGVGPEVHLGFTHRHFLTGHGFRMRMEHRFTSHCVLSRAAHALLHNRRRVLHNISFGNVSSSLSALIIVKSYTSLSQRFLKVTWWGFFNFIFWTQSQCWARSTAIALLQNSCLFIGLTSDHSSFRMSIGNLESNAAEQSLTNF